MAANAITNGGFEAGSTGWTLLTGAVVGTDYVFEGTKALKLPSIKSDFGPILSAGAALQSFSMTLGASYIVRLRINGTEMPDEEAPFIARIDYGSGAYEDGVQFAKADVMPGDAWTRIAFPAFIAVGTTGRVNFAPGFRATDGTSIWWVDDVQAVEVGKTADIQQGIVDDLNDISVANGFATDVAEVQTELRLLSQAQTPAVHIRPTLGGESDVATLTDRHGVTSQFFALNLIVKSATPHAAATALLDDVRNAVERSSSNIGAVAGVQYAGVTEWTEFKNSTDMSNQFGVIEAQIRVDYYYQRGTL